MQVCFSSLFGHQLQIGSCPSFPIRKHVSYFALKTKKNIWNNLLCCLLEFYQNNLNCKLNFQRMFSGFYFCPKLHGCDIVAILPVVCVCVECRLDVCWMQLDVTALAFLRIFCVTIETLALDFRWQSAMSPCVAVAPLNRPFVRRDPLRSPKNQPALLLYKEPRCPQQLAQFPVVVATAVVRYVCDVSLDSGDVT